MVKTTAPDTTGLLSSRTWNTSNSLTSPFYNQLWLGEESVPFIVGNHFFYACFIICHPLVFIIAAAGVVIQ
jgi:hypothetical protein